MFPRLLCTYAACELSCTYDVYKNLCLYAAYELLCMYDVYKNLCTYAAFKLLCTYVVYELLCTYCCLRVFVYCSRGVQHDGVIKILACCPHTLPPLPWAGMKMMKIRLTSTKTSHANEDDGHFIVWAGLHEDESDG